LKVNKVVAMSNWPDWLPLRTALTGLTPYGAPQIQEVLRLNTNENPFALPDSLVAQMVSELTENLRTLNRYPDRDALALREELARYINSHSGTTFSAKNIWAANGSNEILQTLMLAMGERGALGFLPSYSVHPLIAQVTNTPWHPGTRRSDFSLDIASAIREITTIQPGLTFITTPNNPTGSAITIDEIAQLANATERVAGLLIVDEAYAEFSSELSAVTLLERYPNIVVVRTMSKAFAFAGARVGYLVARPEIVDAALITRLPYHLSTQTQVIAEVALRNSELLLAGVRLLIEQRDRVASALQAMGLHVLPSAANFLMFSGMKQSPTDLWKTLVERGILIRDIAIDGYLRVSIGTPAENDQFLAEMARLTS
jgi:histidinol-phosphate aminotransferase